MSVDNKHLAAILLGAAAAFGAYKYNNMSDEEKQKMKDNLKDKFHKLKSEAENSADTAKDYFTDLKTKAGSLLAYIGNALGGILLISGRAKLSSAKLVEALPSEVTYP